MQSFFSLAKWYALFIEKIPFFVPTQTSLSCCRWGHMAMLQIFVASSSLKIRLIKEIFHHIVEASTRALTFASLSRSLTGDWIEYDVGAGIQRSPPYFYRISISHPPNRTFLQNCYDCDHWSAYQFIIVYLKFICIRLHRFGRLVNVHRTELYINMELPF
jgi:hypothetical protein